MAFRLPPLSSLRVFEAAARHSSFQKAASELNLTASAVSHGIQTLETWLGVPLFHRGARGLQLTPAGRAYAPPVNQALGILAQATDRIPGRKATGTLAISCAPTFAATILLPLLERFATQFADIRVTLDTSQRRVDLALDNFDIAIRFAPTKKPPANGTLLAVETLLPVCSPALKKKLGTPLDAEALARAPLIHVTATTTDWEFWFRSSGLDVPPSMDQGLRLDRFQMASDAAVHGLGAILGRRPLVDDEIASGRLVPLTAREIESGNAYWLVTSETDFEKPEVKLFRTWLLAELGAAPKAAKSQRKVAVTSAKTPRRRATRKKA